MKRVLMITVGKISIIPYMDLYTSNLSNVDFELICWNRDGKEDSPAPENVKKIYVYNRNLSDDVSTKAKIPALIGFRRFALSVLKQQVYDKIVILHTIPGILLCDYLKKKYKGNYVLDIRDMTYEKTPIIRNIICNLVNNSGIVFVSSDAFRRYLPKVSKIYSIHNFTRESESQKLHLVKESRDDNFIRLNYWGLVRHFDVNKKLIEGIANNERILLNYYGRLSNPGLKMQEFATSKKANNIRFYGAYKPEEKYDFISKTDLIHNIYNVDFTMGNAVPNKYYDGVIFGIPQICAKGSYVGELVEKKKIGIALDLDSDSVADQIIDYFDSLDRVEFYRNCDREWNRVLNEQQNSLSVLRKFIGVD